MTLSLEEALDLLKRWKDEAISVFIIGQNSSRWGLRSIREGGIDWNISLRGKISEVSVSRGSLSSMAGTIVFKAPGADLLLSMDACAFSYDEKALSFQSEAQFTARSCLFIFFPSNELFVVGELEER